MANTFQNTFKGDLLAGRSRLITGQTNHKMALYTTTAINAATVGAYTVTNEHATPTGYTTAGKLVTIPASQPVSATSASTAYCDLDDVTWSTSTFTATSALLYDEAATTPVANNALISLDFGGSKSSSAGDFTIAMPAAATGTAIIRIA